MALFGTGNGLPKSLLKAAKGILNDESLHEVGDQVLIADGPNSGRTGTVVGSKSSGYSDVQIDHGRHITIKNDSVQVLNEENLGEGKVHAARRHRKAPKPLLGPKGGHVAGMRVPNHDGEILGEKRNRLDDVSKKELKGKFKNRDDQDIDNDGDEDESDEYLHNRRQVVDKKISKKKGKKNGNGKNGEEVEIDPDLEETFRIHRQANLLKASHAVEFLKGLMKDS